MADAPWNEKSGGSHAMWPFQILQQGGAQGQDHTGWNAMPWAWVADRIMALKAVHILTPKPVNMSTLGQGKFADGIKLRILGGGDYPRLSGWAQCDQGSSWTGDRKVRLRERRQWDEGSGNWSDAFWEGATSQGIQTSLEKAETGFHLTASRTNSSANTLTLTKHNLFQSPGFQNCKRMNLHHPKPLNP